MNQIEFIELSYSLVLTAFIVNIAIALYGIFTKPTVLKKIISLVLFSDTINMIAIALGYRVTDRSSPVPPILPSVPTSVNNLEEFSSRAVDPLLQAFVITAVVINLSIMIFLLTTSSRYYEIRGSLVITPRPVVEQHEEII